MITMNTMRTLGSKEAEVVLSLTEQGKEVVLAADVIDILGKEAAARKVIWNLLRKGWLSRLIGGRYLFLPPENGPENLGENNVLAMAANAVLPSYIGWWSAASFHGFTTQKPAMTFVAVLRQVPARTIEGSDVRFVKLEKDKFFGFASYDVYGRTVSVSTPAKTVVDCADHPRLAGGSSELARIVFGASSVVDKSEIAETALKMRKPALLQRLGFLFDIAGGGLPDSIRKRLRAGIPNSARSTFGRRERKRGDIGYVHEWGLNVNIPRRELLSDVPNIILPYADKQPD